jgi:sulfur carrier protein
MITLVLNGSTADVEVGSTVATLVGTLAPEARGVAVAVNEAVVPRGEWSDTRLRPGDRVEVLRAAQGGC